MLKEFIDALRRHGIAVFDLIQTGVEKTVKVTPKKRRKMTPKS